MKILIDITVEIESTHKLAAEIGLDGPSPSTVVWASLPDAPKMGDDRLEAFIIRNIFKNNTRRLVKASASESEEKNTQGYGGSTRAPTRTDEDLRHKI